MNGKYENTEREFIFTRYDHSKVKFPNFHWHRGLEIIHIISGEYKGYINGEIYNISKGDILVMNSGVIHSLISVSDDCCADVCKFNLKLLNPMFNKITFIRPYISTDNLKEVGIFDVIENLFDRINEELCSKKLYYDIIAKSILFELWGVLSRHFGNNKINDNRQLEVFNRFHEGLKYINENFNHDIRLSDVAKVINYSTYHTSKLFSQFTDTNLNQYINVLRVNKALELLNTTDLSIAEITSQSGFNTIKSLNNSFNRILGKSPRDIKKLNKNEKIFF